MFFKLSRKSRACLTGIERRKAQLAAGLDGESMLSRSSPATD